MDSLVSIIMPVYNCEEYIEESIKSICQQTYEKWELIILAEESNDKVYDIVDRINDNRISVVKLQSNKGVIEVFKEGLKYAKGEFIIRHGGDDISSQLRLENQVTHLKENQDLGMVSCLVKCFTEEPNFRKACVFIEKVQNYYISKESIEDAIIKGFIPIIFPTIMIRKSLFEEIELSENRMDFNDYAELLIELIKISRVEKINKVLYSYRRHSKSYHVINEIEYEKYLKTLLSDNDIKNILKHREFYADSRRSIQKDFTLNEDSAIRILMLVDALNIGGTETHVLNLTRSLIGMGVYVVVATSGGPMEEIFKSNGIKVVRIPLSSDYISNKEMFSILKKVKEIIDEERISLLHCHLFASMQIGSEIYRRYKIPYITTLHGLFYPNDVLFSTSIKAKSSIAVSEPVKKLINAKLGNRLDGEIKVIPNGVDTNYFNPDADYTSIRKELNIPERAPLIVYCSRLEWGKTAAAEAFIFSSYKLAMENRNLNAIIIGDGADRDIIEREAEIVNRMLKRKAIHIVGAKFNVLPYYLDSNVVVGTARVAIEALSCGKPVIAIGNQGHVGLITDESKETQWKMYFGDHDALEKPNILKLTNSLRAVLSSSERRRSLGRWGRNWCLEKFDNALIAKETLDIYINVLNNELNESKIKEDTYKNPIKKQEIKNDNFLAQRITKLPVSIPFSIESPLEFKSITFNKSETVTHYCFQCKNRGVFIKIPFVLELKNNGNLDNKVTIKDNLNVEFNTMFCQGCEFKRDVLSSNTEGLNDILNIDLVSQLMEEPVFEDNGRKIILTISTKLYNNKYDPAASNLETGIYGSSTIITEPEGLEPINEEIKKEKESINKIEGSQVYEVSDKKNVNCIGCKKKCKVYCKKRKKKCKIHCIKRKDKYKMCRFHTKC